MADSSSAQGSETGMHTQGSGSGGGAPTSGRGLIGAMRSSLARVRHPVRRSATAINLAGGASHSSVAGSSMSRISTGRQGLVIASASNTITGMDSAGGPGAANSPGAVSVLGRGMSGGGKQRRPSMLMQLVNEMQNDQLLLPERAASMRSVSRTNLYNTFENHPFTMSGAHAQESSPSQGTQTQTHTGTNIVDSNVNLPEGVLAWEQAPHVGVSASST